MGLAVELVRELPGLRIDVAFTCATGELLALVGPSGSGKTTILRMLAGLERPDDGLIRCAGETWYAREGRRWVPPQGRRLGYVFQDYPLFPHLTVARNVGFAGADRQRVVELLALLEIDHLAARRIHNLSGGERQRVALAQALARSPRLLLLDEPFSALDAITRQLLQGTLRRLKPILGCPVVLVTHDLREAALLGDQVVPIEQGAIRHEWFDRLERPRQEPSPQGAAMAALCAG